MELIIIYWLLLDIIFRRIWGGAIPLSSVRSEVGVERVHPVTIRKVPRSAKSTFFLCVDLYHAGQQYSAVEKHSAMAVAQSVLPSICAPVGTSKFTE